MAGNGMNTAVSTVTLAEIAEALAVSPQAAQKRANKEAWAFTPNGRGRSYSLAPLPADVRQAVSIVRATAAAALIGRPEQTTAPAITPAKVPAAVNVNQPLKTTQIDSEMARERIFKFMADFDGPQARAIDYINAGYHAKTLDCGRTR